MAPKYIEPSINSNSFSCPRCGTLANQSWFKLCAIPLKKDAYPYIMTEEQKTKILESMEQLPHPVPKEQRDEFAKGYDIRIAGEVIFEGTVDVYKPPAIANLAISQCYSCDQLTVWRKDSIIYPAARHGEEPNSDLPEDVKLDFEEARTILELSPRGAAALIRLCIQKLCKHLGGKGRDLDADIGMLVSKGLPEEVKQALDVVRVIGGEAVHPGQINLNDNRDVAAKLFTLVNMIADRMITKPTELEKLHGMIPPQKLEAIKRRDDKAKNES